MDSVKRLNIANVFTNSVFEHPFIAVVRTTDLSFVLIFLTYKKTLLSNGARNKMAAIIKILIYAWILVIVCDAFIQETIGFMYRAIKNDELQTISHSDEGSFKDIQYTYSETEYEQGIGMLTKKGTIYSTPKSIY
jgi:hypothetical protein